MKLKSGYDPCAALLVLVGEVALQRAELEPGTERQLQASAARLLPQLKAGQPEVLRLAQQDAAPAVLPTSATEARQHGVAGARCGRGTVRPYGEGRISPGAGAGGGVRG